MGKEMKREVRLADATALELLYRELTHGLNERSGLNITQYRILQKIDELDNHARVKDISSDLKMRSNVVSMSANSMEKSKLVKRVRDGKDDRATYISMTPLGKRTLKGVNEDITKHFDSLWSDLPKDTAERAQATMVAIGKVLTDGHHENQDGFMGSDYITTIVEIHDSIGEIVKGTANITYTAWRVLRFLHDNGGQSRMGIVSSGLFLQPSTLTWIAGELSEAGMVKREADENTPNGILLSITPKGQEILDTVQKNIDATVVMRIWGHLSDDQYIASQEGSDGLVKAFAAKREVEENSE